MSNKGRSFRRFGQHCVFAKLTASQAKSIFAASGLHKDIAKDYGTTRENVGMIKRGKTWSHITGGSASV